MTATVHCGVSVEKCGFIVHPTKGWFGASPNGLVTDPTFEKPHGLIEITCPYSKREMTPEEACTDPNFCCEPIESKVSIKNLKPLTDTIIRFNCNFMLVQISTFGVW